MSHHYQVNWINGMKISSGHFIESENHFVERIQNNAKGFIHNLSYGLLPPSDKAGSLPQFSFSLNEGKIRFQNGFSAFTPGGYLIQIPDKQQFDVLKPETEHSRYYLVVAVNPLGRIPYGEINEKENPLRSPFVIPEYKFSFLPYPHTDAHAFGPGIFPLSVCAARSFDMDSVFIPPCHSILSHPTLIDLYEKTKGLVDEMERKILELLKKQNITNRTMLVSLVNYFNTHKASIDWDLPYKPPVYLFEVFNQIARTIYYSSEVQNIPLREDQRAVLQDIISMKYDHMDIARLVVRARALLDGLLKVLPRDENIIGV